MAMKKSTKKLLKIAGVVTAIAGIGYLVLRKEPPPKKLDEGPPGPGPDTEPGDGPGGDGPLVIPGRAAWVVPQWNDDVRIVAEDTMPGVYAKMGSPAGDWPVVIALARAVAVDLWPKWPWPETEVESGTYTGAGSETAFEVWTNLITMARDLTGFVI